MHLDQVWQELRRLGATLASLEQRILRLEGLTPSEEIEEQPVKAVEEPVHEESAYPVFFTRLAAVCFILVGALVLRVVTQQQILAPGLGVSFGLGYCAILLAGPLLLHRVWLMSKHGSVLQYCSMVLAPLIVVEIFYKNQVLSAFTATVILLCVGLAGALAGVLGHRRGLAAVSLIISLAAVIALEINLWQGYSTKGDWRHF